MEELPDVLDPAGATPLPQDTAPEPIAQLPDNPASHGRPELIWLADGVEMIRATRSWIQYGLVGFTIFCIVVGAVEALFGH